MDERDAEHSRGEKKGKNEEDHGIVRQGKIDGGVCVRGWRIIQQRLLMSLFFSFVNSAHKLIAI